jgi:hypothetical protein
MVVSILGGWLWDTTHWSTAALALVALCEFAIISLASTVTWADRRPPSAH